MPFRFSKNISHRFLKSSIKNITPNNISKRTFVINGKDLYYPKYGTSWYEPNNYSHYSFHSPKDIPEIKFFDKEFYNKPGDKIKKQYDSQPQITNSTEVMDNIEGFDSRVDYDDENIIEEHVLERWNSRED